MKSAQAERAHGPYSLPGAVLPWVTGAGGAGASRQRLFCSLAGGRGRWAEEPRRRPDLSPPVPPPAGPNRAGPGRAPRAPGGSAALAAARLHLDRADWLSAAAAALLLAAPRRARRLGHSASPQRSPAPPPPPVVGDGEREGGGRRPRSRSPLRTPGPPHRLRGPPRLPACCYGRRHGAHGRRGPGAAARPPPPSPPALCQTRQRPPGGTVPCRR